MFQYSPILGRSSIWDLKYTFSGMCITNIYLLQFLQICSHLQKRGLSLLKQTIEKSICKDCGGGKILIRLKIQS